MTPPTTQTGDWEKEFDRFTAHPAQGYTFFSPSKKEEVKSFIRSEITKAVEAEKKEKKTPDFDFGPDGPPNGAAEEWERMDAENNQYNKGKSDYKSNLLALVRGEK